MAGGRARGLGECRAWDSTRQQSATTRALRTKPVDAPTAMRPLTSHVRKEAKGGLLPPAPLGLILELRHAFELGYRRHARQQPRELRVLSHRGLLKEHTPRRVDAAGQERGGCVPHSTIHLAPTVRIARHRRRARVKVDDAKQGARRKALQSNPVPHRAQVVA